MLVGRSGRAESTAATQPPNLGGKNGWARRPLTQPSPLSEGVRMGGDRARRERIGRAANKPYEVKEKNG